MLSLWIVATRTFNLVPNYDMVKTTENQEGLLRRFSRLIVTKLTVIKTKNKRILEKQFCSFTFYLSDYILSTNRSGVFIKEDNCAVW